MKGYEKDLLYRTNNVILPIFPREHSLLFVEAIEILTFIFFSNFETIKLIHFSHIGNVHNSNDDDNSKRNECHE
jgi:hypothetical protein